MTNEEKISIYKARLNKIKTRGKYLKAPGVVRKLNRQIRNCEK